MSIVNADALKNNLGNPGRSNLFNVIIPNPRGGGNSETLKIRCMSASIPRRSFETFNLPYKDTAGVEYAGKIVYDHSWDVTFFEGEDSESFMEFYNWCQLIVDDYAGTGVDDAAYKTDMYFQAITRSDKVPYKSIKLIGCFPKEIKSIDFSNDNAKEYKVAVTLSFDRWEVVN